MASSRTPGPDSCSSCRGLPRVAVVGEHAGALSEDCGWCSDVTPELDVRRLPGAGDVHPESPPPSGLLARHLRSTGLSCLWASAQIQLHNTTHQPSEKQLHTELRQISQVFVFPQYTI